VSATELVMGHFFETQPKISGPTQPTKVFTRPNPTHHRHLVWHIRLYRKLYTTTVTRHRQVHSSQLERKPEEYFMTLKISRSEVSTQPNLTH